MTAPAKKTKLKASGKPKPRAKSPSAPVAQPTQTLRAADYLTEGSWYRTPDRHKLVQAQRIDGEWKVRLEGERYHVENNGRVRKFTNSAPGWQWQQWNVSDLVPLTVDAVLKEGALFKAPTTGALRRRRQLLYATRRELLDDHGKAIYVRHKVATPWGLLGNAMEVRSAPHAMTHFLQVWKDGSVVQPTLVGAYETETWTVFQLEPIGEQAVVCKGCHEFAATAEEIKHEPRCTRPGAVRQPPD